MKNRIPIVLSLLILVAVSAYFGIFKKSGISDGAINIQLQDTSLITSFSITLSHKKVELAKKANLWMVNKVYHANEYIVKRLFRLCKNLDIKTIVPEELSDSLTADLKMNGVRLRFFSHNKEIETYWIGNFNNERKATLLMNSNETPVFATAPGLSSDLRKFVEPDDIFWRDKRIFDFDQKDIERIEFVEYQNQNNSFTILIKGSDFQLMNSSKENTEFIAEKIDRYLSYFNNIRFESLEESFTANKLDSIIQQKPLFEIRVKFVDGGIINLKLLQKMKPMAENQVDLNLVYGLLNDKKPLVIISYFIIDPLLKSIDYFKKG